MFHWSPEEFPLWAEAKEEEVKKADKFGSSALCPLHSAAAQAWNCEKGQGRREGEGRREPWAGLKRMAFQFWPMGYRFDNPVIAGLYHSSCTIAAISVLKLGNSWLKRIVVAAVAGIPIFLSLPAHLELWHDIARRAWQQNGSYRIVAAGGWGSHRTIATL